MLNVAELEVLDNEIEVEILKELVDLEFGLPQHKLRERIDCCKTSMWMHMNRLKELGYIQVTPYKNRTRNHLAITSQGEGFLEKYKLING